MIVTVRNEMEVAHIRADRIDSWGEQANATGEKVAFVIYHSGDRSITIATKEPFAQVDEQIRKALNIRKPAPKKRK